jgi:hypothetical protein
MVLGLVTGLGIVSRLFPIGFILWDKYLGDVLYAAVFYLGLSLIWPKGTSAAKTVLTGMYVIAIETFQLTSIPVQLSRSNNLVIRLFAYAVLGSKFSGWDLLAYGVGLAAMVGVEKLYFGSDLSYPPADPPQTGEEMHL